MGPQCNPPRCELPNPEDEIGEKKRNVKRATFFSISFPLFLHTHEIRLV